MKKVKYLLVALVALSFSVGVEAQTSKSSKKKSPKSTKSVKAKAYQCPMKCEGEKTYAKDGKCPVCNMKLNELPIATAASYSCPMLCEGTKTYAKEGKCPECNMKLKKVEPKKASDGHKGHGHG
jgi:hypothetical protein